MSKAAISLRVFSLYMLILALALILDPNRLLSLFGIAPTREIWIRIVGLLVLILGYYDASSLGHDASRLGEPAGRAGGSAQRENDRGTIPGRP